MGCHALAYWYDACERTDGRTVRPRYMAVSTTLAFNAHYSVGCMDRVRDA